MSPARKSRTARAEEPHHLHQRLGKRKPGHRAAASGEQLLEEVHPAQPAQNRHALRAQELADSRDPRRRRRCLQLDRPDPLDLADQGGEEGRVQRKAGRRWIVLDHDGEVDGSRDPLEVTQ
jgi:hypothetical protein